MKNIIIALSLFATTAIAQQNVELSNRAVDKTLKLCADDSGVKSCLVELDASGAIDQTEVLEGTLRIGGEAGLNPILDLSPDAFSALSTSVSVSRSTQQMDFKVAGTTRHTIHNGGQSEFAIGGSAGSPAVYLNGDSDTGLYSSGTNSFSITAGGTERLRADSVGIRVNMESGTASIDMCATLATGLASVRQCSSSLRYKKDIESVTTNERLDLSKLNPVSFKWKDSDKRDYGLIAEEVNEVYPELTNYKDGEINGLNYRHLMAILIAELQELRKEVNELKGN